MVLMLETPTELDAGVESPIRAQNVHVRLAIVALVRLVHLGLREHNQARAAIVPLELDLVALEKRLLRHGRRKAGHVVHLHRRRLALALRHKDRNRVVLARRHGKVTHALEVQLGPDRPQVAALVELHLVGHDARAVRLVRGVLQVPARLAPLHKLPHHTARAALASVVVEGAPHFEILARVAVVVLAGALPGYNVGAERREAEFKDVFGGQRRDEVADGRVNDGDSVDCQSEGNEGAGEAY
jgi:hypothetical protein